jgi:hypothetical protein
MWTDQPDFFMNNHDKKKRAKKEKIMDIEEMLRQELDNLTKQKNDLQKQLIEIDEKMKPIEAYFSVKKGKGLKIVKRRRRKFKDVSENIKEA